MDQQAALDFLAGGGKTGSLMREFDWATTPLGPTQDWPQALKTLVSVALGSSQPMFIVWGPELTTLYNDGYAVMCGTRHPRALGRPYSELWSDLWHQVEPILARAYAGEATSMDNIAFVMHRNGYPEEAHFAFSYTPVRGEAGQVAGMFCVCSETTGQVLAERRLVSEAERQRRLFKQAPGFICILTGPDHVFEFVNDAHQRLFGDRAWIGNAVREVLPELEGQGFFELLDQVYSTGERFVARGALARVRASLDTPEEECFLDFVYEPVTDEAGQVTGIFCEGYDVTDTHLAQEALYATGRRQAFRLALEERLRKLADPCEIIAAASEELGRELGVGQVAYSEVDLSGDFATIKSEWTDGTFPSIGGRHRIEGSVAKSAAGREGDWQ
jgi:PAS domain-containing protein